MALKISELMPEYTSVGKQPQMQRARTLRGCLLTSHPRAFFVDEMERLNTV